MNRIVNGLLVVTLVAAAAQAAHAAPKKTRSYALREYLVEGSATDKERKTLDEALPRQVELTIASVGTNVEVDRVQKLYGERPHLRDCREKNCLVEIGDYLQADRLISIVIERTGAPGEERGEWEVRLALFGVDSLKYTDRQKQPCHNCTVDEVLHDFANLLEPTLRNDKSVPLCTLMVATNPPGGAVLIDGEPVGLAPFEHTIEAGRRAIGARSADAPKNELEIDCPARGSQKVTFKLDAHGEPPVVLMTPATTSPSSGNSTPAVFKAVGGTLIGVGVLSFVGAGVAGAYNGKGTCGSGNCPKLYDTRGAIAGFAVGGVVLAGAGIGLLVKGIIDSKKSSTAGASSWWFAPVVAGRSSAVVAGRSF